MTEEEFFIWRDYKPDEDLKELIQIESEIEKLNKREQLAKEKERLKQEKLKEKQREAEAKKPKEDFDSEDLYVINKRNFYSKKYIVVELNRVLTKYKKSSFFQMFQISNNT